MILSRVAAVVLMAGLALPAAAAPLRIVTQALPETRGDPFSYRGLPNGITTQAVFEPFIAIDAHGRPAPSIAASWVQGEGKEWRFTLRPGLKFSNGEPLDAAAILSAMAYLMGTPTAADALAAQSIRNGVARVTAPDPLTVVFETKEIDPVLPLHLELLPIPAPKAWAEGVEKFAAKPVGSGPYRVVSWDDARVRLARNSLAAHPGQVDEIEIRAVPDQTARALALVSGTADVAMDLPVDAKASLPADLGYRLQPRTANMVLFIQFVTVGDTPLKDVRVRRALNHAVDKQQLIAQFLDGAVKPATQFTHEDAFGFDPSVAAYPYDPAKAKALLAEAGFPKGFDLPVVFVGGAGADPVIYQRVAAELGAVGVKMTLRTVTLSTWMGHLFSGEWPARAFVTGVQGYDPLLAFTTRSCAWSKPHFCDPNVMPLLDAARAAARPEDRRARTAKLLAYERDNPPGLLLWRRVSFDGIGAAVKAFPTGQDRVQFDGIAAR